MPQRPPLLAGTEALDRDARRIAAVVHAAGKPSRREKPGHATARARAKTAARVDNPGYWACLAEAKVNGLLKQVEQRYPPEHPLRELLSRYSDELGDFIHGNSAE